MNTEQRLDTDLDLIRKGTLEIIGEDELKEKLNRYYVSNKPLVIKLGLDPSAPDIHLGHTVVLRKIRQFQSLGHKAIVIIGDFTGRIGDPTGKSKTRKQLTESEVLANADTYKTQLLKVLDPDKTIICFNSEWLDKITLKDMIEFMSKQSLFRMLEREGFKKRVKSQETIYLHELLYPMLQGLDSMNIEADVELGGMDQKFNILMGRDMQSKEELDKQVAIFMPLLEGLDGKEK
jgi:tyrosyl-tRNA synthetase